MVKLKIMGFRNNGKYILMDEQNEQLYELFLEFHGIKKPNIADCITLDEKLLNPKFEGFAQPYAWTLLQKTELKSAQKIDCAVLTYHGKDFLLKRIYGWWIM